jgi:hypothetical protein
VRTIRWLMGTDTLGMEWGQVTWMLIHLLLPAARDRLLTCNACRFVRMPVRIRDGVNQEEVVDWVPFLRGGCGLFGLSEREVRSPPFPFNLRVMEVAGVRGYELHPPDRWWGRSAIHSAGTFLAPVVAANFPGNSSNNSSPHFCCLAFAYPYGRPPVSRSSAFGALFGSS